MNDDLMIVLDYLLLSSTPPDAVVDAMARLRQAQPPTPPVDLPATTAEDPPTDSAS